MCPFHHAARGAPAPRLSTHQLVGHASFALLRRVALCHEVVAGLADHCEVYRTPTAPSAPGYSASAARQPPVTRSMPPGRRRGRPAFSADLAPGRATRQSRPPLPTRPAGTTGQGSGVQEAAMPSRRPLGPSPRSSGSLEVVSTGSGLDAEWARRGGGGGGI